MLTLAPKGSARHPLGKRRILVQVKLDSVQYKDGVPIAVIEVVVGQDIRLLETVIGEIHDLMMEVS